MRNFVSKKKDGKRKEQKVEWDGMSADQERLEGMRENMIKIHCMKFPKN